MKPISKLYIKVFLVNGVVFASLMAIAGYISSASFSILGFLFNAIFFGGAMSLSLVSLYESVLNDQGITNPSEENLKSVQEAEFVASVSKDEFISRVSKDKVLSRMKLRTNDEVLKLDSGVTWKSMGETISIKISSCTEGMFRYHVQSKPKLPIAMIDLGKNLENVGVIKKLVKSAGSH